MTFLDIIKDAPDKVKRKLEQLKFLRERPDYHPEPSVYEHIKIVTERLIETDDMNLILAGVFHDICKLDTVKMNEKTGYPSSPGHEKASHDFVRYDFEIRDWVTAKGADPVTVSLICLHHMRFHKMNEMREIKRNSYLEEWKNAGIWGYLKIFGAADNMLAEFDVENIEKSWKCAN